MFRFRMKGALSPALPALLSVVFVGQAFGQHSIVRNSDLPSPILCAEVSGEMLPEDRQKKLAGVWLVNDEQIIEIRVAKDKTISSASIRWDEKSQGFATDIESLLVRQIGDQLVLFVRSKQEGGDVFWFFRMEESEKGFSLFLPSAESFEKDAKALDILKVTPKFNEKLRAKDSFGMTNPITLVRVLR